MCKKHDFFFFLTCLLYFKNIGLRNLFLKKYLLIGVYLIGLYLFVICYFLHIVLGEIDQLDI